MTWDAAAADKCLRANGLTIAPGATPTELRDGQWAISVVGVMSGRPVGMRVVEINARGKWVVHHAGGGGL